MKIPGHPCSNNLKEMAKSRLGVGGTVPVGKVVCGKSPLNSLEGEGPFCCLWGPSSPPPGSSLLAAIPQLRLQAWVTILSWDSRFCFLIILTALTCVCVCVCGESQRTPCRTWLSQSALWVLGIELRLSELVVSTGTVFFDGGFDYLGFFLM